MRIINGQQLYKIGEVAKVVNRTTQTINNWLKAQQAGIHTEIKLPEPIIINRIKYFKEEDLQVFIDYENSIKRGDLADYNRNLWGVRGNKR